MKIKVVFYLPAVILFLQSCTSHSVNDNKIICPLQPIFEYFDQLDKTELHFNDLDYRLNDAKGKSKTEVVNSVTREFADAQNTCLEKLNAKFPSGSVKLPFEQTGLKDTIVFKSVYISGYAFPWTTATSVCYYFTFEYEFIKNDISFVNIHLTFYNSEGDILDICSISAYKSGKTQLLIKTQPSFIKFVKLTIN